jgi:hypothetical protein
MGIFNNTTGTQGLLWAGPDILCVRHRCEHAQGDFDQEYGINAAKAEVFGRYENTIERMKYILLADAK